MSTDRTTLRRTIGYRLGDMVLLTATHASAAADELRDVVRLGDRGDNAPSLVNKILYFSGGTADNISHEARVQSFASTSRTLIFTPAADAIPQEGDEVELWSVTERIGGLDTLYELMNAAISHVKHDAGTEVWKDAETFRARSPHLSIPATWVEFGGATWTDRSGFYQDIPPNSIRVQPGNRRVIITGRPSWRANNRSIQLWGYDAASPLTADTGVGSTTDVDPEWLVETVLAWVKLAASARASDLRGPSEERLGSFFAQQAMLYRRNVAPARRGLGVALP